MSQSAKRSLSLTSETAAQPKPKTKARPSTQQRAMSMDSSPLAVPPPGGSLASSAQPPPAQPARPTANHPPLPPSNASRSCPFLAQSTQPTSNPAPLQPFSSVLSPSAPKRSTQATTNPGPWPPSQTYGPRAVPINVPDNIIDLGSQWNPLTASTNFNNPQAVHSFGYFEGFNTGRRTGHAAGWNACLAHYKVDLAEHLRLQQFARDVVLAHLTLDADRVDELVGSIRDGSCAQ
jgi:hypothetical protein